MTPTAKEITNFSVRAQPYVKGGKIGDIETFEQWPQSARGRINDFRGGVWKKFLVEGPCYLTVKVARNSSHNAILAAAMLDKMDALPAPYARSYAAQKTEDANDRGVRVFATQTEGEAYYQQLFDDNSTPNATAWGVYQALDMTRNRNPIWWGEQQSPLSTGADSLV